MCVFNGKVTKMTKAITIEQILIEIWMDWFLDGKVKTDSVTKEFRDFKTLMIKEDITQSEGTMRDKWRTFKDLVIIQKINKSGQYRVFRKRVESFLLKRKMIDDVDETQQIVKNAESIPSSAYLKLTE